MGERLGRQSADDGCDIDVLVVGLGPMGATTALALAQYGVSVQAIARSSWVANTPRAHITNLRAAEVLRSLGVEHEALLQSIPWDQMGDTLFTTSFAGEEVFRIRTWGTGDDRSGDYIRSSPSRMMDLPQTELEPILVGAAGRAGVLLSFNTEYVSSTQDDTGVNVVLLDRITGVKYVRRARYLVGADGARSRVMKDAGLSVVGEHSRAGTVYAQFRGDLSKYVAHRPSVLNWIVNQDARFGEIGLGLLRAIRPWDQWIAGWGFDISQGDPDLSQDHAIARIRAYVGDDSFTPEVTSVAPWYVNQAYAPVLSEGRIFCGGDATHRHPPSSGLGSNTCVQDAFNLAWKLAFVLKGYAMPELLDTYTAERAAVGEQIVKRANQSRHDYAAIRQALDVAHPKRLQGADLAWDASPEGAEVRQKLAEAIALKQYEYNAQGLEMNQRYSSTAVIEDPGVEPEVFEKDPDLFVQATTRPGAKIPHAWLVNAQGRRISSLDVVNGPFLTLITCPTGGVWEEAVQSIAHPALRTVIIGTSDVQDLYLEWQGIREIDEDGALLVRPDGVVAWRSLRTVESVGAATDKLLTALDSILTPER